METTSLDEVSACLLKVQELNNERNVDLQVDALRISQPDYPHVQRRVCDASSRFLRVHSIQHVRLLLPWPCGWTPGGNRLLP